MSARICRNRDFFSLLCEGRLWQSGKQGVALPGRREGEVLKWLFTLAVAVLLLGVFSPWLRKFGFGRMPGDIDLHRNGRHYWFPLGSTILLSLLASLLYWMLR